ncbi:hypothetical protein G6O67_005532 [Ophiocordyceps sinensis]|uniref:Uncharacterized protein n=2 Tax=Ophiocordyceps sinensis TaxID=72228 RepID=A0A8H4PRW7_9HYPO|nr:hypothetical protein OCS_01086 [Ophiocordyceps sinensis CO18]KAF4509257.1 hypothetical protein G6O67_005532 [Ophiocordyceps sinensis]
MRPLLQTAPIIRRSLLASSRAAVSQAASNTNGTPIDNAIIGGGSGAKGRTGGGEPLSSTAPGAPAPPKVVNSRVPGVNLDKELSEEQKQEVDEHNRHFSVKHDRGQSAPEYKADAKFWTGASKD